MALPKSALGTSAVYFNPNTGQLMQGGIGLFGGKMFVGGTPVNVLPQAQQQSTANQARQPFTPNAVTESQLAGMGGGAAPQWMMDAYTNKIGQMGGNANLPPFAVTQSGFPGMGGKTAPAGTTGTGG